MFSPFRILRSLEAAEISLRIAVSRQEIVHICEGMRCGRSRYSIVSATRAEVPKTFRSRFFGVFIRRINPPPAWSPTKLAELFACNIPVLANRGVGDLDQIVNPGSMTRCLCMSFRGGRGLREGDYADPGNRPFITTSRPGGQHAVFSGRRHPSIRCHLFTFRPAARALCSML